MQKCKIQKNIHSSAQNPAEVSQSRLALDLAHDGLST